VDSYYLGWRKMVNIGNNAATKRSQNVRWDEIEEIKGRNVI